MMMMKASKSVPLSLMLLFLLMSSLVLDGSDALSMKGIHKTRANRRPMVVSDNRLQEEARTASEGGESSTTSSSTSSSSSRSTTTSTSTSTSTSSTSITTSTMMLTDEDELVLFGQAPGEDRHPPFPSRHRKIGRTGNVLVDPTLPLNQLDHSTTNPLINRLHTMRDASLSSCPSLWTHLAVLAPDSLALVDDHLCDDMKVSLTFKQMDDVVSVAANVFRNMGVTKGKHVAIFGENSARWLQVDHGLQRAGGVSAVRGADTPLDELRYIYDHSDSAGIAVLQGPKLLQRLMKDQQTTTTTAATTTTTTIATSSSPLGLSNKKYGPVKNIILMNREKKTVKDLEQLQAELGDDDGSGGIQISFWDDLLAAAKEEEVASGGTTNGNRMAATSSKNGGDNSNKNSFPTLTRDDLATIVYTSGTTGQPKGVMLTHGNLLHQTSHRLAPSCPYEETEPLPGETMVSLLPVWHITERAFELWMLSRGCTVVYSTIRTFRNDMAKYQPEWLVLVPRVLEKIAAGVQDKFATGSLPVRLLSKTFTATGRARAVHSKLAKGLAVTDVASMMATTDNNGDDDGSGPGMLSRLVSRGIVAGLAPLNFVGDRLVWSKVKAGFGGKLRTIISGGSALPGSLENFYETAGFKVVVGYGLTECSPLLSYRRLDGNLVTAGCCGKPCLDTEVRVVDPESRADAFSDRPALPDGQVGVVLGRGPQVMRGYYKNPDATAAAVDRYGWFDTGDLGRINPATGDLILTGRAKDTIVLSNGENVEPQPLEDAILGGCGGLVEQVMLTGQDGRRLVAIAVLSPAELAKAGFMDRAQADRLQAANEVINDPKSSPEACEADLALLRTASQELRQSNAELQQALHDSVRAATGTGFRAWEQVSTVHLTLEPFGMVNGQLTQSYKVKRDSVMNRYCDELPK